jgi:Tfp pilus assembly protein FimT
MVELIIVMTIMVVAVSVAAPSLKGFLKGRNQDNEAMRFVSLTRYGASRAVSEGVPVDMWINVKQNKYGLAASRGYTETKTNTVSFTADSEVQIQVSQPRGMLTQSNFWTPFTARRGNIPVIRFQPDGFISDSSPQVVKFLQGQDPEIWAVLNANQTKYELELNHRKSARY